MTGWEVPVIPRTTSINAAIKNVPVGGRPPVVLSPCVDAVDESVHRHLCWFRARNRNLTNHEAAQRSGGGEASCRTNKGDVSNV